MFAPEPNFLEGYSPYQSPSEMLWRPKSENLGSGVTLDLYWALMSKLSSSPSSAEEPYSKSSTASSSWS